MQNIRRRVQTPEKIPIAKSRNRERPIVWRVLEGVSDADLNLLESAARAVAQGCELTPVECATAEAYAPQWREHQAA